MRVHRQVLWKCQCDCGGITYVNITDLKSGHTTSCGCIKSKGEEQIGCLLQAMGIEHMRQYSFEDLRGPGGGRLKFDFAVFDDDHKLQCLIEYQGSQHYAATSRNGFGDMQRLMTDQQKKEYCRQQNIPLYEIRYDEDVQTALLTILFAHDNPVGISES